MINSELLRSRFEESATETVALLKIKRLPGKFRAKPEKEYEEVELKHCVLKTKKSRFETSEAGSQIENLIQIIRIDDKTEFAMGDKIRYGDDEYLIETPAIERARYGTFRTMLIEARLL